MKLAVGKPTKIKHELMYGRTCDDADPKTSDCRRPRGALINPYKYPKGRYQENDARLFLVVPMAG